MEMCPVFVQANRRSVVKSLVCEAAKCPLTQADVVYLNLPVQKISGLSGEFVSDVEHVAVFDFARAERKLERMAAAAKREKDGFLVRRPRHARGPGVSVKDAVTLP